MGPRLAGVLLLLVFVLGQAGVGAAHDHHPPRATLRHGSLFQEGRLLRYHWSAVTEDGGCVSSLILARDGYPHPSLPVGPGAFRARIRLSRPDRPVALEVAARDGDPRDGTLGRRRRVAVTLRPRRPNGEVIGWAAVLRSRVEDDLFLRVTGSWRDRQGCSGPQRATWAFHLSAS
jgi:hypothetical protein